MLVTLIRHGKTPGNLKKCYIGRTDEPLCPEGEALLREQSFALPGYLAVSPMLRCRQTAQILFPDLEPVIVPGLREIDFGRFEGKNWQELSGDPSYQAWIDSGGTMDFPGGESLEAFKKRCLESFRQVLGTALEDGVDRIAFVVHGGTVMAVMEAMGIPEKDYYDWQIPNGGSLTLLLDEGAFYEKRRCLKLE